MEGYIKLYRQIMKWEWYDDANAFRLFIHLLLKANYEDAQWRGLTIKRGQLFTSIGHLSHELKISDKAIRIALDKLIKTKEVASKGASKGTMITICKYDSYQSSFNTEGQTEGQTRGKRGATNNNNNNNKEKKNKEIDSVKSKRFSPPTLLEVEDYCFERKNTVDASKFIDYYTSNGWKVGKNAMKDWRAAVRTWEKTQNNNNNGNKQQNGLDADAKWRAEMQASIARDYAELHK